MPTTAPDDSAAPPVIEPWLLERIVCPVDHGQLVIAGNGLRCTTCNRRYAVDDGIPNLLVHDAE